MNVNFSIPIYSKISSVSFPTFEACENLLCIATTNGIIVLQLKFDEKTRFEILKKFETKSECHIATILPETSLAKLPYTICVCSAETDFKIHFYKLFSDSIFENEELIGHTNFIHSISVEESSNLLASTSDDHTVRVWSIENQTCDTVFHLTSPGITVAWQKHDPQKLMVAEKRGVIRIYNVSMKQAIFSLIDGSPNAASYPLVSAHWALNNNRLIACILQNGFLILWDTKRTSLPVSSKMLCSEFGKGHVKMNSNNEMIAITNTFDKTLKVLITNSLKTILIQNSNTCGFNDICWHFRFPILCVVNDEKLLFFKIDH